MKRLILFILSFAFVLSFFPMSVSAAADTDLMAELTSATVDGVPFNFNNYPKNSASTPELIAFSEVGYTVSGPGSDYGLYLYVYNPTEASVVTNGKNTATLAVDFENDTPVSYEKFSLEFIEATENNRFLKFKVIDRISGKDNRTIEQRVKVLGRNYYLSEFEIQHVGSNTSEYGAGQAFKFSGYGEGITCAKYDMTVIQPEVKYTYFRTKSSDAGVGHQNQLNSVYFTVPNELLKPAEGGFLSRIKLTYNEQRTAPIFVTTSNDIYNAMLPYVGINIGETNNTVPFSMVSSEGGGASLYTYAYNYGKSNVANLISVIPYIFKTDDLTPGAVAVESEILETWINAHNRAPWLFENYNDDMATTNIYVGDTYDLISMTEGWSDFSKWFWGLLGHPVEESFQNLSPFYPVKASDIVGTDTEVAARLFVEEDAASEIKNLYATATAKNETVIIFRYSETDYFTKQMLYADDKILGMWNYSNDNIYIARETIYFDWDMIELEFMLDGVATVVPVGMSPQDHIADITNPVIDPSPDWGWVKYIIAILGALLFVYLIRTPLMWATDAIDTVSDSIAGSIVDAAYKPKTNKNKRKKK